MTTDSETIKREKLRYRLNLILIAFLCSTTLAPPVIFFTRGAGKIWVLFVFILISFWVSRLPKSFYDRVQLSKKIWIYKKLKVNSFKKYATNGDLINRRIRRSYPTHRNVSNLGSIKEKRNETYTIEKSHTVLFVFCFMTCVYAFLVNSYGVAILLAVGNLLFNYYPTLLQQYNRIRYSRVIEKYPQHHVR